jgi:hypothetical protein
VVRPAKIWTPASEVGSLGEDFREETVAMLKKVALENNVDVETLKFSVNCNGIVNIQSMTEEEMNEMELRRRKQKLKTAILERKRRG